MSEQTIVVVDDQPELLVLLRDLLEYAGYGVVTIRNPSTLASQVSELEPALFLIDLMMPGMSGIELAERLRAGGYGGTPMVAMSASSILIDDAGRSGWFTNTIDKPFDIDTLVGCLRRLLDGTGARSSMSGLQG